MSDPRIVVVGSDRPGCTRSPPCWPPASPLHVDVIGRLPAPCGLARCGVVPDHAKMKAVTSVLAKPFTQDNVRFLGNAEVGRDLTHDELAACYLESMLRYCAAPYDK